MGFVGRQLYWYGAPWFRDKVSSEMAGQSGALLLVQVHENEVVGATGAVAYTKYFPNKEKFGLGPKGVKRYPVRRVAE